MKIKVGMGAEDFNNTLPISAQVNIVSLSVFKALMDSFQLPNKTQRFIMKIESVKLFKDHIEIFFNHGSKVKAFFNGQYQKYDVNGNLRSTGGIGTTRGVHKGRVKLKIEGIEMYLERLILIGCDIANGEVAISYKGWEANVMDGSGNRETAEKLGIKQNYSPENLEWCLKHDNAVHGNMIKKLSKITGKVYRFSANDRNLTALYQSKQNRKLCQYCSTYLKRIK